MTASTTYAAERVTYDSASSFTETRTRFDERVPVLDPALPLQLVIDQASWADVEAVVTTRVGPTGFMALARIDQGALMSLNGQPLDATLYLVGNPVIARKIIQLNPAGSLYAPFRLAIYRDAAGVHIAYDQPSTVFASLRSPGVDPIALDLDRKIAVTVEEACKAE